MRQVLPYPEPGLAEGWNEGLGFGGIRKLRKRLHRIAPHRVLSKTAPHRLLKKLPRPAPPHRLLFGTKRKRRGRGRVFARSVLPVQTPAVQALGDEWNAQLGELEGIGKAFKKIGKGLKKVVKSKVFKYAAIGTAAYFTGGLALKFAPKLLQMGKRVKMPKIPGTEGAIDYLQAGAVAGAAPAYPGSVEYYAQRPDLFAGGMPGGYPSPYPYTTTPYASTLDPAGAMPGEYGRRETPALMSTLGISPATLMIGAGALGLTLLLARRNGGRR